MSNNFKWVYKNTIRTSLFIIFFLAMGSLHGSHTAYGEAAFARGNYEKALYYFSKAIDRNEPGGKAHFFTGQILETRRKYKESIPYFAAAVDKGLRRDLKKAALWKLVIHNERIGAWEATLLYIEKLEGMGVRHSKLTKTRALAEEYLTPEKMEARKLIRAAIEIEEDNEESFATGVIFSRSPDIVRDINKKYEKAIKLDNVYENYYWKVARFYEKLKDWHLAEKVYQILAQKDGKSKVRAVYKRGVMQRRRGNYQKSIDTLQETISLSKSDKKLEYFARMNLAQSAFGNEMFLLSQENAKAAVTIDAKLSKSKTDSARSLFCLSKMAEELKAKVTRRLNKNGSGQSDEKENLETEKIKREIETGAKKFNWKYCTKLTKTLINTGTGWEKTGSYLILGYIEKLNDKKTNTLRYWNSALLPPKEEISISDNDDEEELDEEEMAKEDWVPPPPWMRSILYEIVKKYAQIETSKGLHQILFQYRKKLFSKPDYNLLFARASFNSMQYAPAAEYYRKISFKSEKDNKNFFIALAQIKNYDSLNSEVQKYLDSIPKKKINDYFKWFEKNSIFTNSYTKTKEYLLLKKRYEPKEDRAIKNLED